MTILINVAIALFVIWFLSQRLLPAKGVKQITTSDLKPMLKDKQIQFIDVRTPMEYRSNHIRQFENIPLASLSKEQGKLSKKNEVVVICQSGMRSNTASKTLKKLGFKNVTNVKGGMSAWV
jgi:rhodanese-related sulfurtransferase